MLLRSKYFLYYVGSLWGSSSAQNMLGYMNENGLGTKRNIVKAIQWYEKAAKQENPYAFANLGIILEKESPELSDDVLFYYGRAAELGHSWSQNTLGCWLTDGAFTDKDLSKALRMFEAAANSGYPAAYYNLSNAYFHGLGVDVNYEESISYCIESANLGYEPAVDSLVLFYKDGYGSAIQRDVIKKALKHK